MSDLRVLALIDGLGFGGAEALLGDLAIGAPSAGTSLAVGYLLHKDGDVAAARLRSAGVEPVHVPTSGLLHPSAFRGVAALIRRVRPDVLHTHLGYADLIGGAVAGRLGLPAVSTVHVTRWSSDGLRDRTKHQLMSATRRHCHARVLAVSEAARQAYLRGATIPPQRVVTVHNGIADRANGGGAAVRQELGLQPSDVVVAMISVLRPGKGHEVAVEAVGRLLTSRPQLRLLLVGDGPDRPRIEELVRPLGDRVVLAGHRNDVPAVLDAVDVLLHPAEHEAFPTVLLEAMSVSVPIVATRVGGIPEIVDSGGPGLLVPAGADGATVAAALAALVDDADRRRTMGAVGRARYLTSFTAERWAARLHDVYADVLAGARSAAGR